MLKKHTDRVTTAAGGVAAVALVSQIDFSSAHWWKQALVAIAILALGYFANKGHGA